MTTSPKPGKGRKGTAFNSRANIDRIDRNQLLDAILEWGQLLGQSNALDEMIRLVGQLSSLIPCDFVGLWLAPPTSTKLFCVYPPDVNQRIPVPPAPNSLRIQSFSSDSFPLPFSFLLDFLPPNRNNGMLFPLSSNGDFFGILCLNRVHAAFLPSETKILTGIAGIFTNFLRAQHLNEECRRTQERHELLEHIRHYLQQTLDLELLISRIFSEVNTAINAEAQSIWLVDGNSLRCRFADGPGAEAIKQVNVPLGEGIVGKTVSLKQALLIEDAQADTRHSRRADEHTGFVTRTLMSVPLVRDNRAIGAIQAVNKRDDQLFSKEDLKFLQSIADIAALTIENARLYTALENSYDTTLQTLTATLDARDHETEGHSRRVVEYATRLGQQIGISGKDLQTLRRGAMIHDIGKIGIPDAILHKPCALTWEERAIMQKHPQIGYDMLRGVPHLSQEVMLVLMHQERWDGTGYPFGLKGLEIPLFSRLFAIVDTFDAILSDRPYRKGRPYVVARDIILSESGRQFDPALVEAFHQVPPEDWEAIRLNSRI